MTKPLRRFRRRGFGWPGWAARTLPADATAAIVVSGCCLGGLGGRVVSDEWENRLGLPVVEVLGGRSSEQNPRCPSQLPRKFGRDWYKS